MTKINEYVIGFTTNSRILLACVACVFASFSLYAGEPEPLDSKEHQFKVHLGIAKSTGNISVVIENTGKAPVRCSDLLGFGNRINVKMPSGKLEVHEILDDLPESFVYRPQYTVRPSSESKMSVDSLSDVISDLKKPGRYEIWVDITSWIDFDKGLSVKRSSNKLIVFVDKKDQKEKPKQK